MIPAIYCTSVFYLPESFAMKRTVGNDELALQPYKATLCGLIIGLITEYYTSHSYQPIREVAHSCKTGADTNMIYGIALGYKSAIIPVIVLALVIY